MSRQGKAGSLCIDTLVFLANSLLYSAGDSLLPSCRNTSQRQGTSASAEMMVLQCSKGRRPTKTLCLGDLASKKVWTNYVKETTYNSPVKPSSKKARENPQQNTTKN